MSIKGFFKKIFSEKEEKKQETISIAELEPFIARMKKSLEESEKSSLNSIKSNLTELIGELESHVKVLEKIRLEDKKEEQRIKIIVKENLFLFIKYLKVYIEKLKNVREENFLKNISSILSEFSKKSEASYQKATILIGKEMGNVKESISRFVASSKRIIEENKENLASLEIIKDIEKKIKLLEEAKNSKSEIESKIHELELRKKDKNEAVNILEEEVHKIKQSESYRANIKRKEENENKKQEIKKEVNKLRESIDFKHLAGIFHTNEKKMSLVKYYSENFSQALESDSGESLIEILKEINYNKEIENKIQALTARKKEVDSFNQVNETKDIEASITKIKSESELVDNEKSRLEKALEKQDTLKKSLINEIKRELEKININLTEP